MKSLYKSTGRINDIDTVRELPGIEGALREALKAASRPAAAEQEMVQTIGRFESWVKTYSTLPLAKDSHGYADITVEMLWHAWQAAKTNAPEGASGVNLTRTPDSVWQATTWRWPAGQKCPQTRKKPCGGASSATATRPEIQPLPRKGQRPSITGCVAVRVHCRLDHI